MTTTIERAQAGDIDGVLNLLRDSQLPLDGLREHLATTLIARHGERIVGTAALEVYPDGALLRSVAVAPAMQGKGLGHELTEAAVRLAHDVGVPALFLLTTTAERF